MPEQEPVWFHRSSIHSTEENDFIVNNFRLNDIWIGGNDIENEGQFKWSDNSNWNYENWTSGNPNNAERREDCVEGDWAAGTSWNDDKCDKLQ